MTLSLIFVDEVICGRSFTSFISRQKRLGCSKFGWFVFVVCCLLFVMVGCFVCVVVRPSIVVVGDVNDVYNG